jgi:hypothetical protein
VDHVVSRTGRFFWTNGVEYSAWPITAMFAKTIVHIDLPLTILGRTVKSWGANIALCNPGKEKIQTFLKDVDHNWKHAPLNNFTMCNLWAEGVLTAKNLFPKEFESFEFDEIQYLKSSMKELRNREALGVDVSKEIADAVRYSAKYPGLSTQLPQPTLANEKDTVTSRIRSMIGELGVRTVRDRIASRQLLQKLERGGASAGFAAVGKDFGFSEILGCTEFLSRAVAAFRSKESLNEKKPNEAVCSEVQ